ncbi:uncharacterized protein BX663DRAFT_485642 [Cokeromyces recurvatus]|uniref:uncharacterized protein n=1 Tax=Cokeromyces recurvatus TaxID=90255 RepID=UPI00221FFEE2|nr:uncharacterized protein BX663DRAFT_485642 [Cokeromyces recurvatus]KAI7903493.1 hypothetical protein BX663DRAFT_485642 [Cokeromyces recurvatus]
MAESSNRFHPDIEQNTVYEERLRSKNIRDMPVGNERLAALRDLGATFDEGQHKTTKIATPSGTPKLPSFVDASQIEHLLQQKKSYPSPFSASMSSNREPFGRYGEWY